MQPVQSKPKVEAKHKSAPKAKKEELINGIRVLGRIQVCNLKNFTYIYSEVSDKSAPIGKAYNGDIFPIAGSVPDWYEVIYQGKRAYIKEKYAKRV